MLRIIKVMTIVFVIISINSCHHSKSGPISNLTVSPDYSRYIGGHTTGTISKLDPITIDFNENVDVHKLPKEFIQISPTPKGEWTWSDFRAIFEPETPLQPEKAYTITINLEMVFENVPKTLSQARFNVVTIIPDFSVTSGGLRYMDSDPTSFTTTITLSTADHITDEQAEKMFSLKGAYKSLPQEWIHVNSRIHRVTISQIKRGENSYLLPYHLTGQPIQSTREVDDELEIPAKGTFQVHRILTNPESGNFVEILFSDPLQSSQDLEGLIEIEDVKDYTYQLSQNKIQVFFTKRLKGIKKIKVHSGIKSHEGKLIDEMYEYEMTFEWIKPAIRMSHQGTILPSSNGTTIPFETVNLKAVDVVVHKIFIENIPQYLQVNKLESPGSIHRVGQQVMAQTVPLSLESDRDQNEWIKHHLDLNQLMDLEPGVIYKVELGFRKPLAIFPCNEMDSSYVSIENELNPWITDPLPSQNYWEGYYPEGYEWQKRNNPCHISYYTKEKQVVKNVISSDLGLIAKVSNDKRVHILTTNLITAMPEPSINLVLLDYQLQPIIETTTDALGMASLVPDVRPYMAIARKGVHHAYLRLDDGQSLSVSHFNVSGDQVKEGLKALIYGERGVWRPGDEIHLTCMIEDDDLPLPEDYPVRFKLTNPRGAVIDEQVQSLNEYRLHTFNTKTDESAPTGTWTAEIILGKHSFDKKIKIETIQPNRLKADLNLPKDQISHNTSTLNGNIEVKWLTGVNGKDINCQYTLDILKSPAVFKGYEQYNFQDPSKQMNFEEIQAFNVTTTETGTAPYNIKLPSLEDAPGKLQMVLKGKLFEPSGNFSIDHKPITYSPFSTYVGMVLPEKEDRYYSANDILNVQTISLSENGTVVNREDMAYTLYEMSWRWWWDQSGDRANYIGSEVREAVTSGNFKTKQGIATLPIKAPHGGRYFLQVCDNQSGHCTGEEFYVSWYGDDSQQSKLGANVLAINTSEPSYEVGEDIVLTIPGYSNARALVSVENGSGILQQEWIQLKGDQTDYHLQASRQMAPNIYLNVTLVQPHENTTNDMPMRLYGITPVTVSDPSTILIPSLELPESLEPEKEFVIEVTEDNGRPMNYTLAIVDEGLLDITNYTTPDPWAHFNAKEALGVKTWDLFDQVIGSYGHRIERLLSIGGDGEESSSTNRKANRFKPVVKFLGPFHLEAQGSHEHKITLPNYIGSVKTMLVAKNGIEYGHIDKTTPVTKPLMVLGTLPRVLGPKEKCRLPVTVFALDEDVKSVEINLVTDGVLEVDGPSQQRLVFNEPGDQVAYFDLSVQPHEGFGQIKINAISGQHHANHEIEINSRIANPEITEVNAMVLQANQSNSLDIPVVGLPGTNSCVLELSSLPPLNLTKRMNYLIGYPHGCLEQTTSKAFPQLYLSQLSDLTSQHEAEIKSNIIAAIQKIKRFQLNGGGFSYWPGGGVDYWTCSYAGHFLMEARIKGYHVSEQIIESFLRFQARTSRGWIRNKIYNDDLQQAYRLYTLAIGGKPEMGLMNRLREDPKISRIAKWQLATTYATLGQTQVASNMINDLRQDDLSESELTNTYGSPTRNKAIVLEAYQKTNREEEAFILLKELADVLSSEQWMSTQTTAFTLKAIGKTIGQQSKNEGVIAQVEIGDKNSIEVTSTKSYAQLTLSADDMDSKSIKIQNKTNQVLFARVLSSGKPIAGTEKAEQNDLSCKIRIINEDGELVNIESDFTQNSNIKVITTISNLSTSHINDIALVQIIPSGWEIINDRLIDGKLKPGGIDYQDIRDDRIYSYFDLEAGEKITLTLQVNTAYAGKYYMPGILAEAMYDRSKFARTKGRWINIETK